MEARNGGQSGIPVAIFPARLDDKNMALLKRKYANDAALLAFWQNLKPGYDYFEAKKKVPEVNVDKTGKYLYN